jgi:hypothetical protein
MPRREASGVTTLPFIIRKEAFISAQSKKLVEQIVLKKIFGKNRT